MEWNDWLDERIECGEAAPRARWSVVRQFTRRGLLPFLAGHGYTVRTPPPQLEYRIARGLWLNQGVPHTDSDWSEVQPEPITAKEEDQWQWQFILSGDEWDAFWEEWCHWEDVGSISFRGQDRRQDIEAFIWTQIDLEASPQTQAVLELCGEVDRSPSPGRARNSKEDVYLREAADSNQYDGWRI